MKFIVIEGPDGAGKTTQVNLAAAVLRKGGHRVLIEREPFDYENIVKDKSGTPLEVAQRFVNDRAAHVEHMSRLVHAEAQLGRRVDYIICDRYALSTLVYQGDACTTLKNKEIIELHNRDDLWVPDLQIVLFARDNFASRVKARDDESYAYAGTATSISRAYHRFAHVNSDAFAASKGLQVIFGKRNTSVIASDSVDEVNRAVMLRIVCA